MLRAKGPPPIFDSSSGPLMKIAGRLPRFSIIRHGSGVVGLCLVVMVSPWWSGGDDFGVLRDHSDVAQVVGQTRNVLSVAHETVLEDAALIFAKFIASLDLKHGAVFRVAHIGVETTAFVQVNVVTEFH